MAKPMDVTAKAAVSVSRLIRDLGVDRDALVADLEISRQTLWRCCRPGKPEGVMPLTLKTVRREIVKRLKAEGWEGDPAMLWAEPAEQPHLDKAA
jgi:hypothetical protein